MARKILLIDDDVAFLELMGETIRSWGYEVIVATRGKEATEIIKNKNADIVVLDYLMPDMDGMATLKEIRKIDKKVPVIMFTGCSDIKVIEGTEELGVVLISKLSSYQDAKATLEVIIQTIDKKLDKQN
ncbi:MAG: response regulator [Candidatus Omnitrophica bacterium]|nr:response regulator [Candidatus Omnitrophota bacterium]